MAAIEDMNKLAHPCARGEPGAWDVLTAAAATMPAHYLCSAQASHTHPATHVVQSLSQYQALTPLPTWHSAGTAVWQLLLQQPAPETHANYATSPTAGTYI
jgi:hypothetical protein